jgi:hypothetical protein
MIKAGQCCRLKSLFFGAVALAHSTSLSSIYVYYGVRTLSNMMTDGPVGALTLAYVVS